MSIYQKILVALDGSEESFNALRYAINFAKKLKAEVLALTVVQLKGEVSSALFLFLGMEDLFKKGAESILKKAEAIASELGADISTLVRKGDPATEIIDCALTEGCELIASGKTGKTGLAKALLGSTSYKLLAGSSVDVLIVPKTASFKLENLLVPTDGSGPAQKAGYKAINLAEVFSAKLNLLSVVEVEPIAFESEVPHLMETLERFIDSQRKALASAQEALIKRCELEGKSCFSSIEDGVPHEIIIDFSAKKGIDLVVMGSYGKSGIKKFLLGSVTEKVVGLSEVLVLVVKS
jgi:nucleotide-binding universal stress UspA family protein